MKLVVDVGNSRIKWARVEDGRLRPGAFFERHGSIEEALESVWGELAPPTAVLVCSVAGPAFNEWLAQWIASHWRIRPAWFESVARTLGLENGYAFPAQLGNDRWAALVGARGRFSGPLGVIDCGTAATVDVVDDDGRHRGGFILPGLALARQSLLQRTDSIRDIGPAPPGVLGRGTAECVANGTRLGLAGALERCMNEAERVLNGLSWVVTGGEWHELEGLVGKSIIYDPDLVLKGLARALERTP